MIVIAEPELFLSCFLFFPSGSTDAYLNNGKCGSLWMTELINNSSFLESGCVSAKALKAQPKQAPTHQFRSRQRLQQRCCWPSRGLQSLVPGGQTRCFPREQPTAGRSKNGYVKNTCGKCHELFSPGLKWHSDVTARHKVEAQPAQPAAKSSPMFLLRCCLQ